MDITGETFGLWTVLRKDGTIGTQRQRAWLIKCACGKTRRISSGNLRNGTSRSCGCGPKNNMKHGLTDHILHKAWRNMKSRCYNQNNRDYKYYGLRGIRLCREWRGNFKSFYIWSTTHGWRPGLTLDRKDNNRGYSPENCQWTTRLAQSRNTRANKYVVFRRRRILMSDAAKVLGCSFGTVRRMQEISEETNQYFTSVANKLYPVAPAQ
jgi:hypothetical protein